MANEDIERLRMVAEQIEARGIRNQAGLQSIKKVPRHFFVPACYRYAAYWDQPPAIILRTNYFAAGSILKNAILPVTFLKMQGK
jgi:protein-L-isoaspartate O-methyltransferase